MLGEASTKWYRTQAYYDSAGWRGSWAMDGGSLMNQGVHYVDLLRWCMGPVTEVTAGGWVADQVAWIRKYDRGPSHLYLFWAHLRALPFVSARANDELRARKPLGNAAGVTVPPAACEGLGRSEKGGK